ncbi:hypothetical protein AA0X95_26060 [Bacillus sp. 1P10SD]|uniref:hypothetical protein n=1 Tax=Bacillus sp. 1P10SD TaxID=3132265 RepID=UPI0039A40F59
MEQIGALITFFDKIEEARLAALEAAENKVAIVITGRNISWSRFSSLINGM